MNFELIDKNSYFYTRVGFKIHKIKLSDISDIVIVAQNENDNIQCREIAKISRERNFYLNYPLYNII